MRVPEELPDEADRRVDVLLIEDVERDDRGLGAEDLAVGRVELREALLLPAGGWPAGSALLWQRLTSFQTEISFTRGKAFLNFFISAVYSLTDGR